MPLGGVVTGLLFADFDFQNDNNQIVPGQNGPFSLPANATATLDANAIDFSITVDDDDEEFDDGFQDDPAGVALNQTLVNAISTTDANGNTVNVAAGQVLEVEFTLRATTPGGDIIDLLFVAAGPGENQGDLFFVVSTAPIPPGVTLDIAFLNDGGGTPYEDIICFVDGAMIATPTGPRLVEGLEVGDIVSLFDGGSAPIKWIGRRKVSNREQTLSPSLRPVRIKADAFGPDLPHADLSVSQQHRIMIEKRQAEMMFGSTEVLVPAVALINDHSVQIDAQAGQVTYHHIMFDAHEVITANGLPTESFYPGASALRALDAAALTEFKTLFPEIAANGFDDSARPLLKKFEAKALLGHSDGPAEV